MKVSRIAQLQELYLELYCDLYSDVVEKLRVPIKESQRDLRTLRSRVACEGISFLTKSLPQLGKALDRALSKGEPLTLPSTFKSVRGGSVPELFRWLFLKVVSPLGYVNQEFDTMYLTELRQLVYYLYKLEIPFSEQQEAKCLEEFESVDAGLDEPLDYDREWIQESSDLIRDIFASFNPRNIVPRHGPGSVATGENVHEKHIFKRIYASIEAFYPFTEYFEYSLSAVADHWRHYEKLEYLESGTAKVVLVPKDSRGPRIISCEPLEFQWIQQGLGRAMSAHLEKWHITRGYVNFTDQTINRRLALEGSKEGQWVTLDMKEASDRVSIWLVEKLFSQVPDLLAALMATRSTHTKLPSGRIIRLKKFAPMGSCLCFPVEAICFYALAVTSIVRANRIASERKPRRRRPAVYVYGDDIIVRKENYLPLLQQFPSVGLKFNEAKCCTSGLFRESCGCDAYKGVDVTPLRLKELWNVGRSVDASMIAAYVAHSNAAYARSYQRVACLTARLVEERIGELPTTSRLTGYLSWIRPIRTIQPGSRSKLRFNKALQRFEIRGWTLRSEEYSADPNVWSMVLRRFTSPSDWSDPGIFVAPRHSRLKRGWSSLG